MSLELYAKIEHLMDFYDEYDDLHNIYIDILKQFDISSVLDIGCGSGNMLQKLSQNGYKYLGIDLSEAMIKKCKAKNLNAICANVNQVDEKYDAIIAVGDVLNYMTINELKIFIENVKERLNTNGIFVADINTKHGFDIASGCISKNQPNEFLSIDANFFNNILKTDFVYFEKNSNENYQKSSSTIYQYFHTQKDIFTITTLKHLSTLKISMFSNQPDKYILVFQNGTTN